MERSVASIADPFLKRRGLLANAPKKVGATMHDDGDEHSPPPPEVTSELFRHWQKARRGTLPAENMTNPVWQWLFRGRLNPYVANELFKDPASNLLATIDFPNDPRWAGCRLGQSRTQLSDGRVFWIAGEHEDFYDPDFFIYNDVIVEQPTGELRIAGYPTSVFRPTDFHSATATPDDAAILIIGSIGYPDDRREAVTPIYSLATDSLAITEVESFGNQPGWIHDHTATLSSDGMSILIRGGDVLTADGFVENIDEWLLSLGDFRWQRLTMRKWPRFRLTRADDERLHLFEYGQIQFHRQYPEIGPSGESELAAELGAEPNMAAFESLYTPGIRHEIVQRDPEDENDWRSNRIIVDGVTVRFTEDMDHLTVTVEGDLPKSAVQAMAVELQQKLTLIENADCEVTWIK